MINTANANKVFLALLFTGYPLNRISIAMKQAAFESKGFTSDLGKYSNNWSGIEKRSWEQGADQNDPARFSHFNKTEDWARAYRHILENFHPVIFNATNIDDFGQAVYDSGYAVKESIGDTPENYTNGMKKYSPDVDYFIKAKELLGAHILLIILVALFLFIWKNTRG